MAMRLQTHNYKIKNCHTAFVYTIAPKKFSKLFTQRLRWTHGFFKNVIDYKHLFFNKKQGNLGFFILPIMIISAFSTLGFAGVFIFKIISKVKTFILNWQAINFNFQPFNFFHKINFEWFYLNTNTITFIITISLILSVILVLLGRKISEGKVKFKMELLYFFIFYPFIAPTWLAKSVYNIIISKKTVWR